MSEDQNEKPSDDEILAALESTLATEELQAFLSEWIMTNTQRVTAFSLVLGGWMTHMVQGGYSRDCIEGTLPLMIERLWPHEHTMNFTGGMIEDDDEEDEDDDD